MTAAEFSRATCVPRCGSMLHNSQGQKLREVFDSLDDPVRDGAHTETPLMVAGTSKPLKKITRPDERLI